MLALAAGMLRRHFIGLSSAVHIFLRTKNSRKFKLTTQQDTPGDVLGFIEALTARAVKS